VSEWQPFEMTRQCLCSCLHIYAQEGRQDHNFSQSASGDNHVSRCHSAQPMESLRCIIGPCKCCADAVAGSRSIPPNLTAPVTELEKLS
jgi:hypothetical protein